jgi:hypothetical protein
MATPEPINNPMMGMFGNQPTMYPAMMGNMQPMQNPLINNVDPRQQQANMFQGPFSPMYPPQFSRPTFPSYEEIQPTGPMFLRPDIFPQYEEIEPTNLPLKKPMN